VIENNRVCLTNRQIQFHPFKHIQLHFEAMYVSVVRLGFSLFKVEVKAKRSNHSSNVFVHSLLYRFEVGQIHHVIDESRWAWDAIAVIAGRWVEWWSGVAIDLIESRKKSKSWSTTLYQNRRRVYTCSIASATTLAHHLIADRLTNLEDCL